MKVLVALGALAAVVGAERYGSAPQHQPKYAKQLNQLYQKTGLTKESAGRSCGELLDYGMSDSGVYWLQPDGYPRPYQAYCDMKSFGGGWQMCYTTKQSSPIMSNETNLVYDSKKPFQTDGYRSNCKYVPFNQVVYVLHAESQCVDKNSKKCKNFDFTSDEDEKAWFTYESNAGEDLIHFQIAGNTGENLVAPHIKLTYTELSALKAKYNYDHSADIDTPGRDQFAGSVPSPDEIKGLWENNPEKYDIKRRASDFWRGRGVAYKVTDAGVVEVDKNWKYQLVVCDESSAAPVGFFMSGMEADAKGCFKTCDNWCGDTTTDHYRSSWGEYFCNSTSSEPGWCVGKGEEASLDAEAHGVSMGPGNTAGVSFNENGFRHTTFRLMSVGIRYRAQIPNSRNSAQANPTDYQVNLQTQTPHPTLHPTP
mmetsp:Transcript_27409/g.42800  ORF Transcript_27409/g.42800 Transcript_27409/m.42800 type:complete len:423 (-) Transcript_27409:697-1965(-)